MEDDPFEQIRRQFEAATRAVRARIERQMEQARRDILRTMEEARRESEADQDPIREKQVEEAAREILRSLEDGRHEFEADLKAKLAASLERLDAMRRRRRRRRPGKDRDAGGVPVKPNRPKNLEGGAAAVLDFGEG